MKLSTTLFAAAAALSTTVVSAGDFTQDVIFYANMPNMDDPKSLLTASDQTLKTQSTVATCMKKAYALVQPGKKHGTELHDTEILTSGPVEDLKAPEGHALSKRGRRHLADVNAKEEELGATWSYGSWPYVDTLAAHLLGISTGFWAKTTGACYLCDYSCHGFLGDDDAYCREKWDWDDDDDFDCMRWYGWCPSRRESNKLHEKPVFEAVKKNQVARAEAEKHPAWAAATCECLENSGEEEFKGVHDCSFYVIPATDELAYGDNDVGQKETIIRPAHFFAEFNHPESAFTEKEKSFIAATIVEAYNEMHSALSGFVLKEVEIDTDKMIGEHKAPYVYLPWYMKGSAWQFDIETTGVCIYCDDMCSADDDTTTCPETEKERLDEAEPSHHTMWAQTICEKLMGGPYPALHETHGCAIWFDDDLPTSNLVGGASVDGVSSLLRGVSSLLA